MSSEMKSNARSEVSVLIGKAIIDDRLGTRDTFVRNGDVANHIFTYSTKRYLSRASSPSSATSLSFANSTVYRQRAAWIAIGDIIINISNLGALN